jgi:hypothetical protein
MKINRIIKRTIVIFTFGLSFAQAVAADDAYLELKNDVLNDMEIQLVGDKNLTVKLISKTETKKLNEQESLEWIRNIIKSPSIKKDVEVYSKSQSLIFETIFTTYRKYEFPDSLCEDMQVFYIRHLRSPDKKLQQRAFNLLRFQKELEAIPKELFLEMFTFAKENPTYGTDDKTDNPYWNIMFKLACCGRHQESIEWLNSIAGKYPNYELSRKIALIRMGEKKYEKELISKYYKTQPGQEKYYQAIALAYASSEETLKVLALELRNNELWNDEGFNQYVLEALKRSREWDVKLLGFCFFGQKDFDMAEEWCQKKFNTKWDRPKPPVRIGGVHSIEAKRSNPK